MKLKQVVLWGVPPLLLFLALVALWNNPVTRGYFDGEYWESVGKFGESLRIAHARYVDENKSSYQKLTDTALEGMATALDRHSSYYPPTDYKNFQDETKRQYFGIGIGIRKVEKGILITRVFPDGPASEVGMVAGEFVAKVEDETVDDWTVRKVSKRIKGDEGTLVRISLRTGSGEERDVKVIRGRIEVGSVEEARVDINGTGYLRIEQFTERTGDELRDALDALKAKGLERLVLDLRDNSGGLLSAAVEVASEFLEKGSTVVSVQGREGFPERRFDSKPEDVPLGCPLVILINEGSASASEIVAGALAVSGRAKLVGEKSYGKGSVQTVFGLEDESGLRLTTAMYYLPDGSTIHENGIEPDIAITCDEETEAKLRDQRHQNAFTDPVAFEALYGFGPVRDEQYVAAVAILLGKAIVDNEIAAEITEEAEETP